ncbi:MAG: T9SS type A sorting domain-containing protein [Flavobacteriaceae bacterium]|nr:T9SS type A sorting domain-containing protein [Flavobacteriaceae bacterium]
MKIAVGVRLETLEVKLVANDSGNLLFSKTFTIDIISKTLGLDHLESKLISVFPNPFDDYLSIRLKNDTSLYNASFDIFDISGKTILEGEIDTILMKLNLGSLENGFYFIKINLDNTAYVKRIIKK